MRRRKEVFEGVACSEVCLLVWSRPGLLGGGRVGVTAAPRVAAVAVSRSLPVFLVVLLVVLLLLGLLLLLLVSRL
jgi:hypothetical protein